MSVPRSLSPLPHRETQIGERGRSVSRIKMDAMAHALHEVVMGTPPPGAGKRLFATHDHCYRGIALPRNMQYCYDQGQQIQNLSWDNVNAADWSAPIEGNSGQDISFVVSSSERLAPRDYRTFRAYATPNVDSDNTAVSTNPCYLAAYMLLASDYACDLRFYNIDRQEVSATVSVPAVLSTDPPVERTAYLPCTGGRVNEYIVEMKCTTTGNTVTIYQLLIAETRTISQPASAGTALYASATRP